MSDCRILWLTVTRNCSLDVPPSSLWQLCSVIARGPVLSEGTLKSNGVEDGTALYFKDLGNLSCWIIFIIASSQASKSVGDLCLYWNIWVPSWYFRYSTVYHRCATVKKLNTIWLKSNLSPKFEPQTRNPLLRISFRLGLALVLLHFIKREFETLFIHRFSNATMPIHRLPINCFHYWYDHLSTHLSLMREYPNKLAFPQIYHFVYHTRTSIRTQLNTHVPKYTRAQIHHLPKYARA